MDENAGDDSPRRGAPDSGRSTRWGRPAAVGAAGLLTGGLLTGSLSAAADDSTDTSGGTSMDTYAPERPGGDTDPSQPQRSDEELLTGSTASKVEAAALAEYPGATIVRIETDSEGVYEAHLTTAAGERVTVEVGKDFIVTGTEDGGGPVGGPVGGPGGGPGAFGGPSVEQGAMGTSSST